MPAGWTIDRLGIARSILAGSAAMALGGAALALSTDPAAIFAARLVEAVQTAAMVEIPYLQRRIGTLAVIARVAPLIGLLGTLLAIMNTFLKLNVDGPYANSADYAGFLGQALITSIFGIAIAIMGQLGHHFLHGRFRALVHDIEWVGHDMIQMLSRLDKEPAPLESKNGPSDLDPPVSSQGNPES